MLEKAYLMFLVLRIGCFGCEFVSCCALKNGNLRGKPNKRKKRKNKDRVSLSSSFYPHIPQTPRPRELSRRTKTPDSRKLPQPPTHPQLILTSATSGTFRDFGKNDDEKNRFLFLYLRVEPKATSVD